MASHVKKKKKSKSRVLSNVLLVMGVVLLLVAGGMWGLQQWRYHEQDVVNEKLATYVEVNEEPSQAPGVDWEGLKAINDDVCGWLYIPGTTINYPVYQGTDNEHYLRHAATGEWTVGGQLFLDCESSRPGMVDNQSIIYGHHLINGTMFEQIAALDDQEEFDKVDTVWYVTEQGAYELEPLLLYYVNPNDQDVRKFQFASVDEFRTYLRTRLDKAVTKRADAEKIIGTTSHVLTTSTCNYYDGYGRTICLFVPKSEAAAAYAATAS